MEAHTFGRKKWLILILFGLVGQIAWAVENMYFNLFVFDTVAPDLHAITLMVQLSGITATVTTLLAGTLSDKLGNLLGYRLLFKDVDSLTHVIRQIESRIMLCHGAAVGL